MLMIPKEKSSYQVSSYVLLQQLVTLMFHQRCVRIPTYACEMISFHWHGSIYYKSVADKCFVLPSPGFRITFITHLNVLCEKMSLPSRTQEQKFWF
jgi:hypothetical protein